MTRTTKPRPANAQLPSAPRAANHPRCIASSCNSVCTLVIRAANLLCRSDSCTSGSSRNSPSSSCARTAAARRRSPSSAGELPVALAQETAFGELLDLEVAAHREVDDRRGDVERVRLEVDERADLARAQPVGRHELDRRLVLSEQRHALLGRVRHLGAEGGVDRRTLVAPVTSEEPHQPEHKGHEEDQDPAREPAGGRRHAERRREVEALLEDRHRLGHHRALRDADGDRHALVGAERQPRKHLGCGEGRGAARGGRRAARQDRPERTRASSSRR